MLDPIFQKHLDNMRALQEELKATVTNAAQFLNLDDVLRHPQAELTLFSDELTAHIAKRFVTKFIAEGVRFADEMKHVKRKIEPATPEKVGAEQ